MCCVLRFCTQQHQFWFFFLFFLRIGTYSWDWFSGSCFLSELWLLNLSEEAMSGYSACESLFILPETWRRDASVSPFPWIKILERFRKERLLQQVVPSASSQPTSLHQETSQSRWFGKMHSAPLCRGSPEATHRLRQRDRVHSN